MLLVPVIRPWEVWEVIPERLLMMMMMIQCTYAPCIMHPVYIPAARLDQRMCVTVRRVHPDPPFTDDRVPSHDTHVCTIPAMECEDSRG